METNQTAKMVAWLDEERRKDRAAITRLEERLAAQTALVEDQARQINDLGAEINLLRSSLLSISLFDETIIRIRTEFAAEIKQLEEQRASLEQEQRKMREKDREALMKSVEDLRQEVIGRIDRAVQPRQVEEERLSRVATELQAYADNLSRGLEEFERSLSFLEEQRRQDSRRVSDINSELDGLAKQNDSIKAKTDLLEELSRRNERSVTEVMGALGELKQQRQKLNEDQALAEQQRERTMQDMLRRMDEFGDEMVLFSKQFQGWSETHRVMKQQIEDFERLVDRVDRRINEQSEVQRLSEERFRLEWEDFMGDDQTRWRQFTISNEEAWRENNKTLATIQATAAQNAEQGEKLVEHIQHITKMQQELLTALSVQFGTLREQAEDSRGSLPSLT
nr:hypothetical protein [Anaerolineae bacterium]